MMHGQQNVKFLYASSQSQQKALHDTTNGPKKETGRAKRAANHTSLKTIS